MTSGTVEKLATLFQMEQEVYYTKCKYFME